MERLVELKGGFLLFEIPLSHWMVPQADFFFFFKAVPLSLSGGASGGGFVEDIDPQCVMMD